MGDLLPMPKIGDGRTMRVSCHPENGVVVVSLWAGKVCRASFQLPAAEAGRLSGLLTAPCCATSGDHEGDVRDGEETADSVHE